MKEKRVCFVGEKLCVGQLSSFASSYPLDPTKKVSPQLVNVSVPAVSFPEEKLPSL